jgi:TonB-dependent starch-binding outer membrane protein SusC
MGYTIQKKYTQTNKLEKIRFYVSAENLLTFTKYSGMEVEVGGDPLNIGIDHGVYPASRTILGGINLTF